MRVGIGMYAMLLAMGALISACDSPQEQAWHYDFSDKADQLFEEGYAICVIGDAGTGGEAQRAVGIAMAETGCSQVRYVGDVIYRSGVTDINDSKLQTHFYEPYRELLERETPFYMLMGNHDWKQNPAAWLDVAKQDPRIFFPNYYYSEQWGDVCFIGMETTWAEKLRHQYENLDQRDWLDARMEALQGKCELSIGLAHHPWISSGHHGNAQPLTNLFLLQYIVGEVDMYIAGHEHHLSDEGDVDGTRYLISGAGGKLYDLGEPTESLEYAVSNYGFLVLELDRDENGIEVDYRFVEIDLPAYQAGEPAFWKTTWGKRIKASGKMGAR